MCNMWSSKLKQKHTIICLFLVMMVGILSISNSQADIPTGSPTQINGEDWTIQIGTEGADPIKIIIDPDSKDAIILIKAFVNSNYNWSIMRVTSEGALVWSTELGSPHNIAYSGLCLSPNGEIIYTLTEGMFESTVSAPEPEIYLASFEADTGIYIDMYALENLGYELTTGTNPDMLFHPDNPDRLFIHYHSYNPVTYHKKIQLLDFDLVGKSPKWEYTFSIDIFSPKPGGMYYSQGNQYLYYIINYVTSDGHARAFLLKFDSGGTGVPIYDSISVGTDVDYYVKGFSGYGSQIVAVITSNDVNITENTYVQFFDSDLNIDYQYKLALNYIYNIYVIDAYLWDSGLKLSVLGTVKYSNVFPEENPPEDQGRLSFIANYKIDHINGYLKIINVHYHGITQFYERLEDTAFLQGFGYYLTGFTEFFSESENNNGFLAKYSMLATTTPLEPAGSTILEDIGPYITENWISLGAGGGVGILVGGLVIGLFRRKK